MFMEGDCVEQDGDEAVKWFTKAADQGLVGSQTTLAMMYEEGRVVPKEIEKENQWYKKAGFDNRG
jgi:TPR repeat protein